MGDTIKDIRGIIDWLNYPKADDFQKNEDFEEAIKTLSGTIEALNSLKERILDLEDWEKKEIVDSINHNRLRVVHIYINWVDFLLRENSVSEEGRNVRAHEVICAMRSYIRRKEIFI